MGNHEQGQNNDVGDGSVKRSPARNGHLSSLRDNKDLLPQVRLVGFEVAPDALRCFADCFQKHSISVVEPASEKQRRDAEFVSCYLVALNSEAVGSMRAVRNSPDGCGLTIGVGSEYQLLSFPDLQLNALIDECTESTIRTVVAKTVPFVRGNATMQDRIPLVTAAKVDGGTVSLNGFTLNLGSGGMALRLRRDTDLPASVRVTWSLPGLGSISVEASPRWNSGRTVGLQYVSTASALLLNWIRTYSARLRVTLVTSPSR